MKYIIKTKKTLETDNGKSFNVGSDIFFTIFNNETNYHDRYIGEIVDITDTTITIKNIELNRHRINGEKVIKFDDIEPYSCNYVYCD